MGLEKASLMCFRRRHRHSESGVALITTLLLLMLLTGMVVAMVMATNSDMLINGYYRDFKGGFYGADSGLAVVRQSITNQMLATIPTSFPPSTQPIPPGTETTVLNNIVAS
jgi:Tfp pilus assembly protein PilX